MNNPLNLYRTLSPAAVGAHAAAVGTSRDSAGAGGIKTHALHEAIARHVVPGMTLHLAGGIGGPSAAICELIRQFAGRAPQFTLVQSTVCGHALNLVHCGLVRKLICAICADISGLARPSVIVQKACDSGAVELENWSLLSLQQRLMAAAYGVPFMPTRSVLGSSIAGDNAETFKALADPFGSDAAVGAVKALAPDLSIVHGCVADEEGNTLLASPAGEDLWGAFASRNGVIVTVEKIVPAAYLRKYASMVRIPGHRVRAVCEAPLGLHPFSLPNPGIARFVPYEKDTAFLDSLSLAARDAATLDAWLEHWVINCRGHADYLARLGRPRVAALRAQAKARPHIDAAHAAPQPRASSPATNEETMLIVLAREIVRCVRRGKHRLILAGAGVGATAAFLAYVQLREGGYEIDLVTGNGQFGYTPIPGESILATEAGVRTSKMLTDTVMTQGVLVGGGHNECLSVLGAGQVDRFGAINSTRTSTGKFLVGSGGANDALNAREVIVVLNQSRDRFVDQLPYVTGLGDRVTTVVSSMATFRKRHAAGELELVGCFPGVAATDLAGKIDEIRGACGWPLTVDPDLAPIEAPTGGEVALLRRLRATQENK